MNHPATKPQHHHEQFWRVSALTLKRLLDRQQSVAARIEERERRNQQLKRPRKQKLIELKWELTQTTQELASLCREIELRNLELVLRQISSNGRQNVVHLVP